MGLALLRGRSLTSSDVIAARRVAVVNNAFARQYFPDDDPIAHSVKLNVLDQIPVTPHDAYSEIVGVVGDCQNIGLDEPIPPEVFLPYTFSGFGDRTILVNRRQCCCPRVKL